MKNKLRVLVVDDTSLYRKILSDLLSDFPDVEVIGTAPNGRVALSKITSMEPDAITLDIEMPEMDGMEVLRKLKAAGLEIPVIMVSSLTRMGARVTMEALELGAFDFVTKPDNHEISENIKDLRMQLRPKIDGLIINTMLNRNIKETSIIEEPETLPGPASLEKSSSLKHKIRKEIVAIGISTGGPNTLSKLIPNLPANLPIPVVIVQHMPAFFTTALAESLDKKSALRVVEGQQSQKLEPSTVYIAPGGKHMGIIAGEKGNEKMLLIADDPPEHYCKPSADFLFRSVAKHYGSHAIGIIMTGMGSDGSLGLKDMKSEGAMTIAQDKASCVVYGMPREAIQAGVVDKVLPLSQIASEIESV